MTHYDLYNPYTGLTILEKAKLVQFMQANAENGHFTAPEIMEAVEYVIKERPSLGGFILTFREENEMLGAIVIGCTGMGSMSTRHRLMLLAIDKAHRHNGVAKKLVSKAMQYSGGDLSIQVEPGNGEISFFEKLGFKEKYVEMRLGAGK